jgi:ABC-type Zn2+ transport system substrate-binding protein/surface adhesin
MHKHKHIKALFFLGIFSMLLLHQVLPHWHHQHEVEHSHKAVAHSDTHDHHHDVPEKENSKKGLLDLFLEMHIHSVVSNEILVTQNSSVKELNVKKVLKTSISANHYSISKLFDEAEKVTIFHPPNNYFNYYLSSLDTRGPPTLG